MNDAGIRKEGEAVALSKTKISYNSFLNSVSYRVGGRLKKEITKKSDTVRVIVADTKKGFGCRTLIENQYEWHRRSPNDQELENLIGELCEETI